MDTEKVQKRLRGPIVPMPTPFNEDHSIDFTGIRRYTRFLIDNGIKTISPLGTTGEFFSLTMEEHKAVMETVVKEAAGQALVIAGSGHSGTEVAGQLAVYARSIGADAVLVCPPYYRYDGEEAIYQHYRALADRSEIPIVVYSNQDVMENISLMGRLADIPNVVGAKEATGNYALYRDLCLNYSDRLAILGGGSMGHYLWGYLWGSPGYFTSVGNFVPKIELDFFDNLTEGNLEEAKKTVREIEIPFMKVAVRIGWWRALKATLDIFGLPGGYSRLPSRTASQSEKEELEGTVRNLGLL